MRNATILDGKNFATATSYALRKDANIGNQGALTLESISIWDGSEKSMPPITFTYGANPILFAYNTVSVKGTAIAGSSCGGGPCEATVRQETKDLWGYYYFNPYNTNYNDFNAGGNSSGAPDAWSLTGLSLPNGLSLNWQYEPNRYDMSNNIPVQKSSGGPRFGGGIRVKQLKINGGGSTKEITRSYFYTNQPGIFVETATNSSGHATVEPYDYISKDDYRNDLRTRGGLYTPAKVAYEMVQVINGYIPNADPTQNGSAPFGYNVVEFYSPTDWPNLGGYGDIDMSVLRGLLKAQRSYNSNKVLISEKVYNYDWHLNMVKYQANPSIEQIIPCAMIRLKEANSSLDKVVAKKTLVYANNANDQIASPDAIRKILQIPEIQGKDVIRFYDTKLFGDPNKDDFLIVEMDNFCSPVAAGGNIWISIIKDIDWDVPLSNRYSCIGSEQLVYHNSRDIGRTCPQEKAIVLHRVNVENVLGSADPEITIEFDFYGTGTLVKRQDATIATDCQTQSSEGSFSETGNWLSSLYSYVKRDGKFIVYKPELIYDDYDGQPDQIIETNSDGSTRITEPIPGYWKTSEYGPAYNALGFKHMLTQTCMTKVWGKPATEGAAAKVLRASVTTWTKNGEAPVPSATYVWKQNLDAQGMPVFDMPEFNFDEGATNDASWICTGKIAKYSDYSQVLESIKAPTSSLPLTSATLYDKNFIFPIASVTNATYGECFSSSFEDEPTWTKYGSGSIAYATNLKVTGAKSAKVTSASGQTYFHLPWQILPTGQSYPAKKFVFSGWVYSTGPAPRLWLFAQVNGKDTYEGDAYRSSITTTTKNQWVFLEKTFDVPANARYYSLRIDNDGGTGEVYFDEMRFLPDNALMTSSTYDQVLGLVKSTTDANNKTRTVDYDGFGRVTAEYNASGKKVKEYKYHLMNEYIKVLSPNGGQTYTVGSPITISWESAYAGAHNVYISWDGGATYPADGAFGAESPGIRSFSWNARLSDWKTTSNSAYASQQCKIKIQSFDNSTVFDESDAVFTINRQ